MKIQQFYENPAIPTNIHDFIFKTYENADKPATLTVGFNQFALDL